MLKFKLIGILISLKSLVLNITHPAPDSFLNARKEYKVTKVGKMYEFLESSGLETYQNDQLLTHNDSGGDAALFVMSASGVFLDTLLLNVKNIDWEDVTRDDAGSIYVGDFGNNLNKRKNLVIYKYSLSDSTVSKIEFRLADQDQFPPDREHMDFDIEAMAWNAGELVLVTKNRGSSVVRLYKVPDQHGSYQVEPTEEIAIPNMVTGADISTDGRSLALLTYGRIYLFKVDQSGYFAQPWQVKPLIKGQTEGIVYVNNTDMIVSNEAGKLFSIKLK